MFHNSCRVWYQWWGDAMLPPVKETRKTNDLKNHLESQNALTNLNNYEKEQTNDYC